MKKNSYELLNGIFMRQKGVRIRNHGGKKMMHPASEIYLLTSYLFKKVHIQYRKQNRFFALAIIFSRWIFFQNSLVIS